MTREQALIRARGIWAEAGRKGSLPQVARSARLEYLIVQPDGLGHQTVGWGSSWEEAVELYERRVRGAPIVLFEEEILELVLGERSPRLRARLLALLEEVRRK